MKKKKGFLVFFGNILHNKKVIESLQSDSPLRALKSAFNPFKSLLIELQVIQLQQTKPYRRLQRKNQSSLLEIFRSPWRLHNKWQNYMQCVVATLPQNGITLVHLMQLKI